MLALVALVLLADSPPSPDVRAQYAQERASASRAPDDQVRLALWCEAHGLPAERLKHLALAVLADPAHAPARGLMGLVARDGRWLRPDAVATRVGADPAAAALLADYDARRQKAAYTADGQWTLGLWCDEHGLTEQAKAHFTAVVRLDPGRETAWRRLGYKKHEGRWTTDAQLAAERAEAEAQKQADAHWKPALEKWKAMLAQPSKRDEARTNLASVTDPRAVAAIGRVFGTDREADQTLAVQLLGQIDAPAASRALAYLSVFAKGAQTRRMAAETLKNRDVREFAGLLVALLRDPIKYEVRRVGGPGSPGALFVQGERFNVQRLYSPPAFAFAMRPGDMLDYDANGLPLIRRPGISMANKTGRITADHLLASMPTEQALNDAIAAENRQISAISNSSVLGPLGPYLARHEMAASQLTEQASLDRHLRAEIARVGKAEHKATSQFGFGLTQTGAYATQIPIGQMMMEAQRTALAAEQQLESDVNIINAYNGAIQRANDLISPVLAAVAGKDLGQSTQAWKAWYVDQLGYSYKSSQDDPKPTFVENVPLSYQPQQIAVTGEFIGKTTGFERMSCFGAGTPVRTLAGSRPIETLRVGDLVLTQSTATGALGYRPILVVHHNPPSGTYRIKLDGSAIVSSHFHRFWVAGRGWVMARDLKAGDPVRTLDGVKAVESVEPDVVQPVFNLDVAGDADFFAGVAAALVHDNTLPDTRLVPFDAAPAVARGR